LLIWVGGLTRLTGSGLSITEWELFSGILPPLNQNKWNEYFDLYKQIPEYKKINYGMSLSEFKFIFWWEYIHRVLARFLVLFYIIPFVYFFLKNKIKKNEIYFFLLIFIFFLLQGFMGWYMVKSGLVSDTDVSHYRLAAHLSLAIIIYCMIFWSLLNYKKKIFFNCKIATFLILFLIILILVQIIWGAFTSGLNAGLLYQTWPLMNEQFIANDVNIKNIISIESLSNPSYVQLLHRLLAYFIILYTFSIYFFYFRRMNITKPFKLIFFAICIQVVLGIFTLISNLNIYLASLHQIGSILLISCTIYTLFYVNKQQNLIDS
jgi:cytochrome c oxidase assembly protein subunit 15